MRTARLTIAEYTQMVRALEEQVKRLNGEVTVRHNGTVDIPANVYEAIVIINGARLTLSG